MGVEPNNSPRGESGIEARGYPGANRIVEIDANGSVRGNPRENDAEGGSARSSMHEATGAMPKLVSVIDSDPGEDLHGQAAI